MFFKLFNKKKKYNISEEVPSYKDRILEQRYINKKDKMQEIKTSINNELKHMVENGYSYGSVSFPSLKPLKEKDVVEVLKEIKQNEHKEVSFMFPLAEDHYSHYNIYIRIE